MPKGNLTMNFSAYGLFFALGIAISAIVAILICKKEISSDMKLFIPAFLQWRVP